MTSRNIFFVKKNYCENPILKQKISEMKINQVRDKNVKTNKVKVMAKACTENLITYKIHRNQCL